MIRKIALIILINFCCLLSPATYSLTSSAPIVKNNEHNKNPSESDNKEKMTQLPLVINNFFTQTNVPEKQILTNHEKNLSDSIIEFVKFIVYLYGICSILIMAIIYASRNLGAKKLTDKIRVSRLNNSKVEFIYNALLNSKQDIVLLNGKWGSGKSTFIKNNLVNDQLSQSIPFVYLNCSEFESYRELLEQLIINSMSTVWLKIPFTFNLIHLLAKLSPITLKEFIFAGRVIIFDDVERLTKLKNIEVEMIISLICYLQEQKQSKIILVANEEELINNNAFASLREKIICDTFSISKPFNSIYNDIVKDAVAGETDLIIFENKDVHSGIQFFYDHTSNIRIIKHQIRNVLTVSQWWKANGYDKDYLNLYLQFIFGEDGYYTELFYLYTKNPYYLDLLAKLGAVYANGKNFINDNLTSIYKHNSVHDLIAKFNFVQNNNPNTTPNSYAQQQIDDLLKQILAIDDFGLISSSLIIDKLSNYDWTMTFNKKLTNKISNAKDISQMSMQAVNIFKQQFEAIDKGDLSSLVEHYFILEDNLNFAMSDDNPSIKVLNEKLQTYISFALDTSTEKINIPQKGHLPYVLINALILDYIINHTAEDHTDKLERLWEKLKNRSDDTQNYENLMTWLKNNIEQENGKYFENLRSLLTFIFKKLTPIEKPKYFKFCYNMLIQIYNMLIPEQCESVNSLLIEHMDYENPQSLHSQYVDLLGFINYPTLKEEDAREIANNIMKLDEWKTKYSVEFIDNNSIHLSQLKPMLYPDKKQSHDLKQI